jgi:hypothetical protein
LRAPAMARSEVAPLACSSVFTQPAAAQGPSRAAAASALASGPSRTNTRRRSRGASQEAYRKSRPFTLSVSIRRSGT